jgi:hypothetical protein
LIVKVVADVITDAVFDTSISRDVGPYLINVVQSCRLRVDFYCDNEEKSWNDYGCLNDPHGCYAGVLASDIVKKPAEGGQGSLSLK